MDIVTKTKTNIDELNQRFFLILENFVPNYISYLKEPSNSIVANEIQHVKSVVNKIESDGFVLKNSMDSTIETSQQVSRQQNIEIEKLKLFTEALKIALKSYFKKPRLAYNYSHFDHAFRLVKDAFEMIVEEARVQ